MDLIGTNLKQDVVPAHIFMCQWQNIVLVGVVKYICESFRLGPHPPFFFKALSCELSRPDVSRFNMQGGTVIVDRT